MLPPSQMALFLNDGFPKLICLFVRYFIISVDFRVKYFYIFCIWRYFCILTWKIECGNCQILFLWVITSVEINAWWATILCYSILTQKFWAEENHQHGWHFSSTGQWTVISALISKSNLFPPWCTVLSEQNCAKLTEHCCEDQCTE